MTAFGYGHVFGNRESGMGESTPGLDSHGQIERVVSEPIARPVLGFRSDGPYVFPVDGPPLLLDHRM
jgi:hypothetical protein